VRNMLKLESLSIEKTGREPEKFLHRPVRESHFNHLITASSLVKLEGASAPILYLDLNEELEEVNELWPHLDNLNIPASSRTSLGTKNKSILFGAVPPTIMRNSYCSFGAVADRDSELATLLYYKYSTIFHAVLQKHLPQWEKINMKLWKDSCIHKDYQLGNSLWTSGIINKNSPQKYHYDGMNVRNMLSAMITLKRNMSGGYLTFPEYDLAFEVKNRSLIFFSGSTLIHGVSPLSLHEKGTRYSIVYYTTKQLQICDAFENEIKKATK
jgi:hypothetical protein